MKATITIGAHTTGHGDTLRRAGFQCTTTTKVHEVECEGIIEGVVDVSTQEAKKAALQAVVASKKLWSYSTKFLVEEGKIQSSIIACQTLGALSAFVVKPIKAARNTNQDILDAVL